MKVAIVYPEVYDLARFKEKRKEFPPFGPLYIAASVEAEGHEVHIKKLNKGKTTLDLSAYDVVGFSLSSSATYNLIQEARFTSSFKENALVIGGGVHANFYPERTLKELELDAVGIEEGEETVLDLLKEASSRKFERVQGICYLHDGEAVRTPKRTFSKDIDWLPLPARHLLDREDVVMDDRLSDTNLRMAHVMFSRGCPFPCRFCAAARQRMQYRNGWSARRELEHLIDEYNIEGFSIVDDNFIVNKKRVHDICEKIRDLNLRWSALSRVDTVDEDLLKALVGSGCIEIKYGIESGSEKILRAMDKNITQDQISNAVKSTRNVGINVKAFIVHGFPGETYETSTDTLEFLQSLKHLISRVSLFRFVPLPGTYVYNHADIFQLRNTDQTVGWDGDWSRYHIHHNNYHWWGSEHDFMEVNRGYELLRDFIDTEWPARH